MQSYEDALEIMLSAPGPDRPGRTYYSNLGFFLQGFKPPLGASEFELDHFLRLVRLMDGKGQLKPGALAQVEADFARALTDRTR